MERPIFIPFPYPQAYKSLRMKNPAKAELLALAWEVKCEVIRALDAISGVDHYKVTFPALDLME